MPRSAASRPNWFEVWNRRSRLRSASHLLASPKRIANSVPAADNPTTPAGGTRAIAGTATADDNAGGERPPKHRREGEDEDDTDPQYRLFLDHLKVDGKSYLLEMKAGDAPGPPLFLKYEEEEEDSCNATPPPSDRSWGKLSSKTKYCEAKKKKKSSSRLDPSKPISAPGECEVDCSMVDDNYQIFLNHVREYNGSMILELDNNVVVIYEEEDDSNSEKEDSEDEVQEMHIKTEVLEEKSYISNTKLALQPYCGSPQPSNYSVFDDGGCSIESVGYTIPSLYGQRLKIILDKPFDQSEYDRLMSLATARTPKRKLKHLRNMSKPYVTNELGRSYLDYFPQLAKMIKCADYHDGLILLRGFFYWLENVVHDGAFKPWECAWSSYETLPSSGCNPALPLQI